MKENMVDYLDAPYILLEQHYRTWDTHLCHWGRFYKILYDCVHGPHDDLLTQMYKHFHNYLMRYLIYVQMYDVFMYFHDLYFVLMMFVRVKYQKWDPKIALFHLTWNSSSIVGLTKQTNLQLF